MEKAEKTKYQIFIDDNFHYMDEDERIAGDVYATAEDAIAAAKKIVDKSLRHEYRHHPGLSAEELWDYYTDFGDDPFIRSDPHDPDSRFSAWNYAEDRAKEIVKEFDEKKWELIRPLLKGAAEDFLAAGKSMKEFVAIAFESLDPAGRPYFEKFVKEELTQAKETKGAKCSERE